MLASIITQNNKLAGKMIKFFTNRFKPQATKIKVCRDGATDPREGKLFKSSKTKKIYKWICCANNEEQTNLMIFCQDMDTGRFIVYKWNEFFSMVGKSRVLRFEEIE